jgi:tetratricopeptide (TPR) repeat protein
MDRKIIIVFLVSILAWPLGSFGQRIEKYVQKADTAMVSKDFRSALKYYNKAINKKSPDKNTQATLLYKRAICEFALKQLQETFADCDSAIALNPQYISVYFFRAQSFDILYHPGLALNDYTTILSLDSAKSPIAKSILYASIANDYELLGHNDDALQNDSLALALDAQNSRAYFTRGDVFFKENKFKEAANNFDFAIKYFTGNKFILVSIYYEKGEAHISLEAYKAAINDYSQVLQIDPGNKLAYWKRAAVYKKHGDYALAINDYTTAIGYYKNDNINLSKLYDERAASEINADLPDAAMQDDDIAIEKDTSNNNAYLNKANACSLGGDHKEGLITCRLALRHSSYSREMQARIYYLMADDEYFLKEFDKAKADCDTSLSLDSGNLEPYYYRAKVNMKTSEKKRLAIKDFKSIVSLDTSKSSEEYIFSLYYLGQSSEAFAALQQKLLNTSDNIQMANNYFDFARLYALMNKPDDANNYLKMAVDKGYSKKYIMTDEDLENIRNTDGYKAIVGDSNNAK